MLKRCGEVTTSVALMIANPGINEARYIAQVVEAKGRSRFMDISTGAYGEMTDALTGAPDPGARLKEINQHRRGEIDYQADRSLGALELIKSWRMTPASIGSWMK